MTSLTSWSSPPASIRLTSDVIASSSLLFVLFATRSFRCCGVKPSGPPEDPAGTLRISSNTAAAVTVRGVCAAPWFGRGGSLLFCGLVDVSAEVHLWLPHLEWLECLQSILSVTLLRSRHLQAWRLLLSLIALHCWPSLVSDGCPDYYYYYYCYYYYFWYY